MQAIIMADAVDASGDDEVTALEPLALIEIAGRRAIDYAFAFATAVGAEHRIVVSGFLHREVARHVAERDVDAVVVENSDCKQLDVITPGHAANSAASDEFERRELALCEATPMDADTVAALEQLRALGLKLVVSSNTGQSVVDDFAAREAFRFDLALGFDPALGLAKGRPHVERALATFGVTRDQLLFVGDSLKDADLAADCGVAFIGRLGTFSADDFRRRDPAALCVADLAGLVSVLAYKPQS
jgi:phosphoglycolate phosphatase-like HAD superfamily hydrolase